jgi:hypothetical protein
VGWDNIPSSLDMSHSEFPGLKNDSLEGMGGHVPGSSQAKGFSPVYGEGWEIGAEREV